VSPAGDEFYVEHGRTFFTRNQSFGTTPGHKDGSDMRYRIFDPVASVLRCFRCHSTGPISVDQASKIQPFEPGVHCESCHGPGEAHVRAGGGAGTIRNPGRLNALEMNDYCGACHRKAPEIGEENDWDNAWNTRHQPAYLNKAACFRKSGGALRCVTCHDPHTPLSTVATDYDKRCQQCHAKVNHRTLTAARACVGCHMPQVRIVPGLEFANHWIGIYSAASRLVPVSRSQSRLERLQLPPTAEGASLPPADPSSLIPVFEDILARREKEWGPADRKVAGSAIDLGRFLQALGRPAAAEVPLRKALTLDRANADPQAYAAAELLASNLLLLEKPQEAFPLFQNCANGSLPDVAAKCLANLGALDEPRAKDYYKAAIRKQEEAFGKDDPKVATLLNDLGLAYRRENDHKSAEPLFRRALAIQQKALGPAHPTAAATMNNLGSLLQSAGRPLEAERYERLALQALERRLGPESKEVATTCANLADLLWSKGDRAGAEPLYRRTLAIDESIYGQQDPEVGGDLMNLGLLLKESRRLAEANLLLRRALAIFEQTLGAGSPQAVAARQSLQAQ
jgi:tetratricopeptide (TPR) repeat protein